MHESKRNLVLRRKLQQLSNFYTALNSGINTFSIDMILPQCISNCKSFHSVSQAKWIISSVKSVFLEICCWLEFFLILEKTLFKQKFLIRIRIGLRQEIVPEPSLFLANLSDLRNNCLVSCNVHLQCLLSTWRFASITSEKKKLEIS